MAQAQSRKLSLVTNSDIVSLAEIEDAYFEGEFTMSTAREEMREGFLRVEMSVQALTERIAAIEAREKEAKAGLQLAHDERTGRRAVWKFIGIAATCVAALGGAAWTLFTFLASR